ncbi:hypothetical protein BDP27DRAFT_1313907 [Rhodocollybia butyracea]|uniref:Uncharacterized protein n=1 Tax=Rhodocollybia butyracea TaxID=206335 RepID=A0A9P5Q9B1_9AGAR|nr:hypothetical protein BDP27DRAFT_1313907 [Rhodocollybia butyracea]
MASPSTNSMTLKRTWSRTTQGTSSQSTSLPPLPQLNGQILLQVLTHRSLRRFDQLSEDFDNERLSELGENALAIAISIALFHRRPVLSGKEMLEQRRAILSQENLDGWVTMYGLRERVRCMPDLVPSLRSPEETRLLFCAYVGAVYIEGGMEPVQTWLDGLINNDTPTQSQPTTATTKLGPSSPTNPPPYINTSNQLPPQKRAKSDIPVFFAAQPFSSSAPKPMPHFIPPTVYSANMSQYPAMTSNFSNPITPAQPKLAFLPLFNQTATQRRVTVEYPAVFSGPSHAGSWTVTCQVNGIAKGMATGKSKQIAKEDAARQAWYNMGWS